jgi:hypothetical protein
MGKSFHPHEAEISMYLSSDEVKADPRHRCMPVYEILQVPDDEDSLVLVLAFLRPFDDPAFDTFGESVDFFSQMFAVSTPKLLVIICSLLCRHCNTCTN